MLARIAVPLVFCALFACSAGEGDDDDSKKKNTGTGTGTGVDTGTGTGTGMSHLGFETASEGCKTCLSAVADLEQGSPKLCSQAYAACYLDQQCVDALGCIAACEPLYGESPGYVNCSRRSPRSVETEYRVRG